ncbi:MAG: helix-turn-helix domain-containing protein [Firmicutes bacterium]|nr:helix-turn-helix domain-containing protein [Bacillota bacterium]
MSASEQKVLLSALSRLQLRADETILLVIATKTRQDEGTFLGEVLEQEPAFAQEWKCFGKSRAVLRVHRKDALETSAALLQTLAEDVGIDARVALPGAHALTLAVALAQAEESYAAGRCFYPNQPIYRYEDLVLERLLLCLPTDAAKVFVQQSLGDLAHGLNPDLQATLQTFFREDLSLTEAAKQLYLHRNSISYRLEKVRQASGRDVRHFQDAVLVYLGLLLSERVRHQGAF